MALILQTCVDYVGGWKAIRESVVCITLLVFCLTFIAAAAIHANNFRKLERHARVMARTLQKRYRPSAREEQHVVTRNDSKAVDLPPALPEGNGSTPSQRHNMTVWQNFDTGGEMRAHSI